MIETLNALMIARPILVSAKSNADHPLYHHVEELPNFVHIEALQILYAQLEVFTNFYDSAQNFNVSKIVFGYNDSCAYQQRKHQFVFK